MDSKGVLLFLTLLIVIATATARKHDRTLNYHRTKKQQEGGEVEVEKEVTLPPEIVTEETEAEINKNYFINLVHLIGANASKNLEINDNKVVWSPFTVVNALTAISNDEPYKVLKNGFKTAFTYIKSEFVNTTVISVAYTRDKSLLESNLPTLKVSPLPNNTTDINHLLQETFLNLTHHSQINQTDEESPEERLTINLTNKEKETVFLTGLGVESLWETPFHPRYAKKSKFYLNSTHVVKHKFLNNIGFYKFANLTEFNASAVAVPLKNSCYLIIVKPNDVNELEQLNSNLESSNFTEIFRNQFRTKRVQLSIPRVSIDSQFVLPVEDSKMLHISSIKISYTGVYNNFAPPKNSYRPIKFTRLRRRKDDAKMKVNSPFIFYVFDNNFSGFLLSGMVLNPLDPMETEPIFTQTNFPMLNPQVKLAKEASNDFCMRFFHFYRKTVGIYSDIFVPCLQIYKQTRNDTDLVNYEEILRNSTSLENLNYPFHSHKLTTKQYFRNELEFFNSSFVEISGRVGYLSYSPFDMRIIQLRNITTSVYILLPNEKSGLNLIENGLEHISFSTLLCQMREINLRLRLPDVSFTDSINLTALNFEKNTFTENVNGTLTIKGFKIKDKSKETDGDLVPIDRRGYERKKNKRNKRYRKLNVDRPFVYIVTEESTGGIIAMGRVVSNGNNEFANETGPSSSIINY